MTIQKTFIGAAIITILASMAFVFLFENAQVASAGSFALSPALGAATTSTAVAVTSSTRLLATTTNPLGVPGTTSFTRQYATICNPSATLVYVLMNNDKPADTTHANTIIAAASGYSACFEITDRNLYNGSIQASSTNQTSVSILVNDYTY